MPTFRAVVEHVRYWRGGVHRWSTSYLYSGVLSKAIDAPACELVRAADDAMCYATAAADGGTYACSIYDLSTGGSPLASEVLWNWEVPGSWVKYSSAGWASTGLPFEPVAEIALAVEWAGGLSRTGKGVRFRKWYHAVPASTGVGTAPDVIAADVTKLQTHAQSLVGVLGTYGLTMGSASGRLAGTATVLPFYGNHQMPKGRRRKALVTASGKYTGPNLPSITSGEAPGANQAVD